MALMDPHIFQKHTHTLSETPASLRLLPNWLRDNVQGLFGEMLHSLITPQAVNAMMLRVPRIKIIFVYPHHPPFQFKLVFSLPNFRFVSVR